MSFEEQLQYLQEKTHVNENIIGCYLLNYGDKYICSGCHSCGCKHLAKCKLLHSIPVTNNEEIKDA